MIRTWALNITPLYNEERYKEYYKRLPAFRREKADRLKSMQARAQSAGVWILYEEMKRTYAVEGTPFNLSHSGEYALCALETDPSKSAVEVGCDIEKIKRYDPRLAARFFCRGETERIMCEKDEEKRRELFFRYWVLKESFVKATGRGLPLGLDSFEVLHGCPSVLLRQPCGYPGTYHYQEFTLDPEGKGTAYRVAVCSTGEIDAQIQKGLSL